MARKDFSGALEAFKMAEAGLPNNTELLVFKAFILRRQGLWEQTLECFERAVELNPRHPQIVSHYASTLNLVRRYQEALTYQDRTIALSPEENTGYVEKAITYWTWQGDLTAARAVLESIPAPLHRHAMVLYSWFRQDLYERDYVRALHRLAQLESLWINPLIPPKPLLEAFVHTLRGDSSEARRAYQNARDLLEKELTDIPKDFRRYPTMLSSLGLAYAGLGKKEEAIREGEAALAFLPISRDALLGAERLLDLALIYAMVGEPEMALERIEYLLSIPSAVSVPLLRLDPRWIALHEHPRFMLLVENVLQEQPLK